MNGLYQTWSLLLLQAFLGFHDIFPLKSQNWIRSAQASFLKSSGLASWRRSKIKSLTCWCRKACGDGANRHFLNWKSLENEMVYSVFQLWVCVYLGLVLVAFWLMAFWCTFCVMGFPSRHLFRGRFWLFFLWFSNHPKKQFSQVSGANKGKGPTTSGNPHHEIQSDNSFPPAERNELYYVATIALE